MNMAQAYYLAGVDGGGTGCRVAIADASGHRLGEATGGPANFTTSSDTAIRSVLTALDTAAASAGLPSDWSRRCTAHIGLAGIMSPQDAEQVVRATGFAQAIATDDRATSVAGALGDHDGILAAIGTGTIVAARDGGETRYFGGWGHDLADQASGGWLGRAALRRTMLAYDGLTEHTGLSKALLARFDDDAITMNEFAKQAQPGDYAGLARMIIEAATAGDALGVALMRKGAAYLHTCIETIGPDDGFMLCLAGGVGPHYAAFLAERWRNLVQPPRGTALDGALALAKQKYEEAGGLDDGR